MLPNEIIQLCTLQNNSPALTLSIEISQETGEILDFSIKPTILTQVKHISYNKIDDILMSSSGSTLSS